MWRDIANRLFDSGTGGMRLFWREVPLRARLLFFGAVFCVFATIGFLADIMSAGHFPPGRLAFQVLFSGSIAVLYGYVALSLSVVYVPVVLAFHMAVTVLLSRTADRVSRIDLTQASALTLLDRRLHLDAIGTMGCILLGYMFFVLFITREGKRAFKAYAEITLAGQIHASLVPDVAGQWPGLEYVGRSLPSGTVGGDLVDVIAGPGCWLGYVADVSGHGVPAGVLMAMVKSAAHTHAQGASPPETLLPALNAVLCPLIEPNMFVTAACVWQRERGTVHVSLAGHVPVLWYRAATGVIHEIASENIALGIADGWSFTSTQADVEPGDLLVVLTDGLTEVFDRQDRDFGLERVKDIVRAHARDSLAEICNAMIRAVRAYGVQIDDQTIMLVRVLPAAGGTPVRGLSS